MLHWRQGCADHRHDAKHVDVEHLLGFLFGDVLEIAAHERARVVDYGV